MISSIPCLWELTALDKTGGKTLDSQDPLDKIFIGRDPPDPESRKQSLGETPEIHDEVAGVDRLGRQGDRTAVFHILFEAILDNRDFITTADIYAYE